MSDKHIMYKLSELISEGEVLRKTNLLQYKKREIKKFHLSAENILSLRFGDNSRFYKEFVAAYKVLGNKNLTLKERYYSVISNQVGVLEACLDALKSGLVEDLFYQRELLVFSEMLDQAFEFLEKKMILASAMYGRVVLETTIKEFAKKNNISSTERFDQIIISLRKNELIHKPLENSLRSNYEIGTWAAHGDNRFNNLTSNEIKEFLSFIRDKVLTLA
ncbi:MAG: DUF4145 domain-containing protein [Candidatus Thermoplasmatota archaeon]|nr:DUF4145 domain-containing protein [Candidatus Thermoplasmatota archaeon]